MSSLTTTPPTPPPTHPPTPPPTPASPALSVITPLVSTGPTIPTFPSSCSAFQTLSLVQKTLEEMFRDRHYRIIPHQKWSKINREFRDLKMLACYDSLSDVRRSANNEKKILTNNDIKDTLPSVPNSDRSSGDRPPEKKAEANSRNQTPRNVRSDEKDSVMEEKHGCKSVLEDVTPSYQSTPRKSKVIEQPDVFVYFAAEAKVLVKKMREYIQHMQDSQVSHAIIVFGQQITTAAKREVPLHFQLEFFQVTELIKNITKHQLVPKHERIASEIEVQKILSQYKLAGKHLLPRFEKTEPIVRYYNWPPGSVIRIHRRCGNLYYRHVLP